MPSRHPVARWGFSFTTVLAFALQARAADGGALLLRDLQVAPGTSISTLAVGDTLYFTAGDLGSTGMELFKTVGTTNTTTIVRDINPGSRDSAPGELFNLNGTVYFAATHYQSGRELYRTDGTAAGTTLVKNIAVGPSETSAPASATPEDLVALNGRLFFTAIEGVQPTNQIRQLWTSDGTAGGTVKVAPAPTSTDPYDVDALTVVGSRVFFSANGRTELWSSDGTTRGTAHIKSIYNNGSVRVGEPVSGLTAIGDRLYFSGDDVTHGKEPWRSDGTATGTFMIADVNPNVTIGNGGEGSSPYSFAQLGDSVLFSARISLVSGEARLFKTRGNAGDVTTIRPGLQVYSPLYAFAGGLVFGADDGDGSASLWFTDGTDAGTREIFDVAVSPSAGSTYVRALAIGDLLYFVADDGATGRELWVTDGTTAGTRRLTDLNPGIGGSDPRNLTDVSGRLHFVAFDGTNTNLYVVPEPAAVSLSMLSVALMQRRRRGSR